jgi:alpha-tubulin suppressor-like RCC1 family protein
MNTIDINSIGYRWKGIYSPTLSYSENDVVYYNGGAYVIRSGALSEFALGQQDAILSGHLLTGGISVGGFGSMVLHSNGGSGVEFRFLNSRNGTLATQLMDTQYSSSAYTSSQYMMAIMNDKSVRSWGRQYAGQGGAGNQGDIPRHLPVRVAFPPGTPAITQIRSLNTDTFYVDAGGGLWHSGENSDSCSGTNSANPIPRKINGYGDLGSNVKVAKVFTGQGYYGYRNVACIDTSGKVYAWGNNQYNVQGMTGSSPYPRLVPFTSQVPISDIHLTGGYYGASFYISTTGQLYVAGEYNTTGFGGGTVYPHKLWMPWGTNKSVKKITSSESYDSYDGSDYLRAYCALLTDGSLYRWGQSGAGGYGSWGTGYTGDVWPASGNAKHPYKILDGVADMGSINGGYGRTLALMTDGTVKHTGYDSYGLGGGSDRTTWATIGGSYLTNGVKLIMNGGGYFTSACLLRSDGKAVVWGHASNGCAGNGRGNETQTPNSFVLLDKTIIDVQSSGYIYQDDNRIAYHFLTSSGEVFSTGYGGYSANGDADGNNRWAPAQILF